MAVLLVASEVPAINNRNTARRWGKHFRTFAANNLASAWLLLKYYSLMPLTINTIRSPHTAIIPNDIRKLVAWATNPTSGGTTRNPR